MRDLRQLLAECWAVIEENQRALVELCAKLEAQGATRSVGKVIAENALPIRSKP